MRPAQAKTLAGTPCFPLPTQYTAAMEPCTLLYFAWLRERTGVAEETLALPPDIRTVADLVALLTARGAGFAHAFASPSLVRAAVNHVFARPETAIAPGDEIAFFPPVTGG